MTSSPAPDLEPRTFAGRSLVAQFDVGQFGRVKRLVLEAEADAAAESGRLREALEAARVQFNRAEAASGYLDGDPDAFWMEFAHVGTLLATPPAPSDHGALDVERLARALAVITSTEPGALADIDMHNDPGNLVTAATAIAAEYARLAAPSVPPEPASPEAK